MGIVTDTEEICSNEDANESFLNNDTIIFLNNNCIFSFFTFNLHHHCKLATGMHKPKVQPELQMQQILQVDLLLRTVNFTVPVMAYAFCIEIVINSEYYAKNKMKQNNLN